jgi:hypothetical protein
MNANGRRARQARKGYKHLARLGGNRCAPRPIYSGSSQLTVHELIARERRQAALEASRKKRGK